MTKTNERWWMLCAVAAHHRRRPKKSSSSSSSISTCHACSAAPSLCEVLPSPAHVIRVNCHSPFHCPGVLASHWSVVLAPFAHMSLIFHWSIFLQFPLAHSELPLAHSVLPLAHSSSMRTILFARPTSLRHWSSKPRRNLLLIEQTGQGCCLGSIPKHADLQEFLGHSIVMRLLSWLSLDCPMVPWFVSLWTFSYTCWLDFLHHRPKQNWIQRTLTPVDLGSRLLADIASNCLHHWRDPVSKLLRQRFLLAFNICIEQAPRRAVMILQWPPSLMRFRCGLLWHKWHWFPHDGWTFFVSGLTFPFPKPTASDVSSHSLAWAVSWGHLFPRWRCGQTILTMSPIHGWKICSVEGERESVAAVHFAPYIYITMTWM